MEIRRATAGTGQAAELRPAVRLFREHVAAAGVAAAPPAERREPSPAPAPAPGSGVVFALYIIFIVSWFVHLTSRVSVLGLIRFDMLLVGIIGAYAVMRRAGARSTSTSRLLGALLAYVVITLPFVEWPGSVLNSGLEKLIKAVMFYFFTVAVVTTEKRLRLTIAVFTACQVFRFLEPLYLNQTQGYWGSFAATADWGAFDRLSGAPHDVVNPNGLAFVVLTAICFMHFAWWARPAGRLLYVATLPLALYTLTLTGSRSGMVGLMAILGAAFVKSRHKAILAAIVAVGITVALPKLGEELSDRYLSLFSSDTKNAGTAEGRIEGIRQTLIVAMRRPLVGHGLGTSAEANANYLGNDQPAHNLLAEVAEELGFLGLFLFVGVIWTIGANLTHACRAVRSRGSANTYLLAVADALQTWLWLNLVFSLASYGLTSYEWYLMAGLSEVLKHLAGASESAAAPAAAAVAPRWNHAIGRVG